MRIEYYADVRFPLERANGIQTAETCYALAARGHAVTLVVRPDTAPTPRDPWAFYGLPARPAVDVVRVPTAADVRIRRTRYLASAVARVAGSTHDVVFTRDLGVASFLLSIPRSMRPPVVYESHGMAAQVSGSLDRLLSGGRAASLRKQQRLLARDRRVWTHAEGYVTITETLRADLVAAFGPRDDVAVAPDGLRLPAGRELALPPPRARMLVGYAGHLYPWKGVDVLLEAIALVPDVDGLVIGGHPAERDLDRVQALARSLGIDDRVTFTGLVPPAEVLPRLAAADVLVLPNRDTTISSRYTSPLKLFEYLAAGRAIVASDLPAIREVLTPDVAVLVPPDAPDALAAALHRLASAPAQREALARRAFDLAPAYTWDRRAARLEALFDHVCRRTSDEASRA